MFTLCEMSNAKSLIIYYNCLSVNGYAEKRLLHQQKSANRLDKLYLADGDELYRTAGLGLHLLPYSRCCISTQGPLAKGQVECLPLDRLHLQL